MEEAKKYFFPFLTIFNKNTSYRVTKIYTDVRTSSTYKSYFINFFLTQFFYIPSHLECAKILDPPLAQKIATLRGIASSLRAL